MLSQEAVNFNFTVEVLKFQTLYSLPANFNRLDKQGQGFFGAILGRSSWEK